MGDWDFILAPATVTVRFRVDEVAMLTHSLRLLNIIPRMSGLGAWVTETAASMSADRLALNNIVCDVLEGVSMTSDAQTFPDLIAAVREADPDQFPSYLMGWMTEREDYAGDDVVLADDTAFVTYARSAMAEKIARGYEFDEAVWRDRYYYITHPHEARTAAVEHVTYMWAHYLRAEWRHVKPTLEEAKAVFSEMDYSNMNGFDIIEAVTGRNMRGHDKFTQRVKNAERFTFIPSAHIGPYIAWNPNPEQRELLLFFGARPPKNATVKSTELNRSELLVRLNALADETRLKILELLTQHHELCAQDFINMLELSQSSASRHLRQLTASGYVSERRRDVAKCYSLNEERIDDTICALKDFLRKS
jgi:DNA-binding transcriptional ArsR family regulator